MSILCLGKRFLARRGNPGPNSASDARFSSGLYNLDYWHHFREMEHAAKKDLVQRDKAVYNDCFLDCVNEDRPN